MGGKLVRQRPETSCVFEEKAVSYRVSDYGSWARLSLKVPTPEIEMSSTEGSDVEVSGSGSSDTLRVAEPVTKRPTRQTSKEIDLHLSGFADKLIHVKSSERSRRSGSTPLSIRSTPRRSMDNSVAEEAAALHYSLSLQPELSPIAAQNRKLIIARSFLKHMNALIEQMQPPEEIAEKLYGIGILEIEELHRASEKLEGAGDRARELAYLLKRKLFLNPVWFTDVCKILRNCEVTAIAQVVDEVHSECPEEVSTLSSGSFPGNTSSEMTRIPRLSYHDLIAKVEAAFKEGGFPAATECVEKYTEQGDFQLVHEACCYGVAVSTLELLFSILPQYEDKHITNSKDQHGRTPLHTACASLRPQDQELEGNSEQRLKIEHLLSHGANLCGKDKDGNTPLHLSILRNDHETVSMLLKSDRRCINIVNKRGNSGLHLACRQGQVEMVKLLCSYRANTSIQNNKTRTALHLACIHNHIDTAVELASFDQSALDAFDKHKMTPLHICCKRNNTLLALALLRLKNCIPYKMDQDSKTPLHYSVAGENVGLVTALLQKDEKAGGKGLLMDTQDKYGDTALHVAGRHGNKAIAKQLLNYKANKDLLNQEGKTALEVAIECDNNLVAAKMLRKRAWHQRRKTTMRKVYKMRRTLTQSTLVSTSYQSETSNWNISSSESEDDESTVTDAAVKTSIM